MEYKTGDPDYVWKCHGCMEYEKHVAKLEAVVEVAKYIAKLKVYHTPSLFLVMKKYIDNLEESLEALDRFQAR